MCRQMLDRVPKQKVRWVHRHGVAVLALLVVAAVFVAVAELSPAIACFAVPIMLKLVGVVAIGLGKCPVVVAEHLQELDPTH